MSRRLEPTVFLAMISPITVGLVVGGIALGRITTGSWAIAAAVGVAVWVVRVVASIFVARRIRSLAPRIDPFALRDPWRPFVRDALRARQRLDDSIAHADAGPLRDRLLEVAGRMTEAVEITWDVARRGQQLTDARRAIDLPAIERTIERTGTDDPRHRAAVAQRDSRARLAAREDATRDRLEILEARIGETVVRASELATRSGGATGIEELEAQVGDMVTELDSLRIALDEIGPDS